MLADSTHAGTVSQRIVWGSRGLAPAWLAVCSTGCSSAVTQYLLHYASFRSDASREAGRAPKPMAATAVDPAGPAPRMAMWYPGVSPQFMR